MGRNYLRVRGEYTSNTSRSAGQEELPPRTRRILFKRQLPKDWMGTTSAYAENTVANRPVFHQTGNYLRVRGEYTPSAPHLSRLWELPPRTRRIHRHKSFTGAGVGTTSAYAENTFFWHVRDCGVRPLVCFGVFVHRYRVHGGEHVSEFGKLSHIWGGVAFGAYPHVPVFDDEFERFHPDFVVVFDGIFAIGGDEHVGHVQKFGADGFGEHLLFLFFRGGNVAAGNVLEGDEGGGGYGFPGFIIQALVGHEQPV